VNQDILRPFASTRRPPDPGPLDPDATAVLVVDMQYFDAHRDWGYGHTARRLGVAEHLEPYFRTIDAITPRIQRILSVARDRGFECIHLRVAERTPDSRDVGYKQLVRGLVVPPDSKEGAFLPGLTPLTGELVISKSSSGVFPATNLDRILRNMGIRHLVFTGTVTGGCVESAVHDAADLGYGVMVVDDACADTRLDAHRDALARMEGGRTRVVSTSECIGYMRAAPRRDPANRSGLHRVKPYLPRETAAPPGAENPTDHIFPEAIPLPVTGERTALLLQDFQRLYCDPGCGPGGEETPAPDPGETGYYYDEVTAALRGSAQLLSSCRKAGVLPIHVRTAGLLPGGRDLSPRLRAGGIGVSVADTAAAWMPPLAPGPGEIAIEKPGIGAFHGTGLDERLRHLGIEHLILGIVSPDAGLEATLRSATDRGYGAIIVPEACAVGHPRLRHRLLHMEVGIINVRNLADILREQDTQGS